MFNIETYQYLPKNIRTADTSGEFKKFMDSIDASIGELANYVLQTSWDIQNADRDELFEIAESLGLHPMNYMRNEVIQAYIRSSGRIRQLKGSDDLIIHLVDTLTHFRVYDIEVYASKPRQARALILVGNSENFETEQRILDFLIHKYGRLSISYLVAYLTFIQAEFWEFDQKTLTKISQAYLNINMTSQGYKVLEPFQLEPLTGYEYGKLLYTERQERQIHTSSNDFIDLYSVVFSSKETTTYTHQLQDIETIETKGKARTRTLLINLDEINFDSLIPFKLYPLMSATYAGDRKLLHTSSVHKNYMYHVNEYEDPYERKVQLYMRHTIKNTKENVYERNRGEKTKSYSSKINLTSEYLHRLPFEFTPQYSFYLTEPEEGMYAHMETVPN